MQLNSSVSAVITGGASGLGAATARALADQGVKVALFDLNEDLGEALAAELGGVFCKVNVSDEASVVAGFAKARKANGQERILFNCAGIGNAMKTVGRDRKTSEVREFPFSEYIRIVNVNQIGTFLCTVKSAAGMLMLNPVEGERGVIVNTASVAAEDGQVGQVAYSATKAAVVGMTLPIARDLSSELIRLNTILPGIFDTPLLASAPENVRQALGAQVPHPARLGAPPEYASLALEMCRNGYFNGEDVRLDGAIRMAPR
ncbi:SDR family NAD(P)-dependent oxidoreductase [Tropicibacter sp. Alg240-R139]|uniref:SDR family NAD(P)-dependent oxidoreductase n=1 Tax=Tropicibacter sp. Alg240-R139 TaxID=2305991 RepID=UPI0013DF0D0A|nr:SDR family NAD(P)-dependent oxidoreductase [Tropicibacter sp. Alg240-R139]